jgi:aldehyde:ferredoxin oxidoreductase
MAFLYGGTILRVDLSKGKISKESTLPYAADFLGGRGINIKILYDGVPPGTNPLDPSNLLIFGVGPLCGTPVPASRVEITAKSPETGFLGTSNFGGFFGPELKYAGYDNIVITGKAEKPVYLWIYNQDVEIREASHLWGKDTYDVQEIIRNELGADVKIACIGQAGENLVHFATVQHELGHGAGRTGMGCVMGSKNLKAIVVRGTKGVNLADPEKYLLLTRNLEQTMREHPAIQEKQKFGVSRVQNAMYNEPDPVTGEVKPSDLFLKYQPTRSGCFGCPTQCMDAYPIKAHGGGVISCALYFGTSYVHSEDSDLMLETAILAHRYGYDVVSLFQILGWIMELYEKGIITSRDSDGVHMEWGNRQAVMNMLEKIVNRDGFGDILADGMLSAAKRIGRGSIDYANHMKGLPLYDRHTPEELIPLKGEALAVAMSSRGDLMKAFAIQGLGYTYDALRLIYNEETALKHTEAGRKKLKELAGTDKVLQHEEYTGKPEAVAYCEDIIIIDDCLSACKNSSSFLFYPFEENCQAALYSAGTGTETSVDKLFQFAKRVKNLERAYNIREGMTRDMDSLPNRFMDRPLEQGPAKNSTLLTSKFEKMKDKYYALRGWDITTGIPTRETLQIFGLSGVIEDLEKMGKVPSK